MKIKVVKGNQFNGEILQVEDNPNLNFYIYGAQDHTYLIDKSFCINWEDYLKEAPELDLKISFLEQIKQDLKPEQGLRFNTGKLRYDLIHPKATEGLVKVLTAGSIKYAPRNWEKGMSWSTIIASLKRHLAAIEKGEDYDPETGELHIDHVQCNSHFLSAYYKIAPQFDDRAHSYLSPKKIGLDIDEVIADWVGHWCEHHSMEIPSNWWFDFDIASKFEALKDDEEFWMSIPPKIKPSDIPFEPHCYITSRNIPVEWTMKWLAHYGFPQTKVYSIGHGMSKVDVAKESGIDIFVDDRFDNFVELNKAGICTYLLDAPHNQRYDVGHKRIFSLKELV